MNYTENLSMIRLHSDTTLIDKATDRHTDTNGMSQIQEKDQINRNETSPRKTSQPITIKTSPVVSPREKKILEKNLQEKKLVQEFAQEYPCFSPSEIKKVSELFARMNKEKYLK